MLEQTNILYIKISINWETVIVKFVMLGPIVIGVVLHRLGLKYNFGQVEVEAKPSWTSTWPRWT